MRPKEVTQGEHVEWEEKISKEIQPLKLWQKKSDQKSKLERNPAGGEKSGERAVKEPCAEGVV